jgi:hypothetical protein
VRYKKLSIGIVAVAAVVIAGWAGLKSLPASLGYVVEAEFAGFPPDDTALEEWLRAQPGVAVVFVGHRQNEPKVLVVHMIMTRDGWGRPPFPDLESKCDELGYRGRVGRFLDRGPAEREKGITKRTPDHPAAGR